MTTNFELHRNPFRLAVSACPWRCAWYLTSQVLGAGVFAAASRVRRHWREPASWRGLGGQLTAWAPLAVLNTVVISVWAALLAGVTLPFWYWAPRGAEMAGYIHGSFVHGVPLGYFPHGPAGRGSVGLFVDSMPKAMLAAAAFAALLLLFNRVLVRTARTVSDLGR